VGALFSLSKMSISASITGCIPEQHSKVTSVADYIIEGKFTDISAGGNRIILGDELMKRLGAGLDQTVLVTVGTSQPTPFKVVGRFKMGNRGIDLQAFGALADIQKINKSPNRVTEIAVKLNDFTQANSMATNWSSITPEKSESWDQQFENVLAMFKIQNALRFSMIATVLIVAGFGIYNVLNMTVNQKRQDIAILRSMGYDTFDVVFLFFSQGMILGLIGGILGLMSGYLLCVYLQTIPFSGGGFSHAGNTLHISLAYTIYLQAMAMALISAVLASVIPARAAGKLTPIEIIRSGG
jgi:lipoprotein-releasing system permease protein